MRTETLDRGAVVLGELEVAYSEWSGGLLRFITRLCGNRDDAEDILVETYTEAYRTWHSFRGGGSRKNWLYGIAANRVRMSRRKQRFHLPLDDEIVQKGNQTIDAIALYQEIAKLPLRQREAFLLVKGEEITAREAAEILGRPLGTVLYDVYRAVHALRDMLGGRDLNSAAYPCQVEP